MKKMLQPDYVEELKQEYLNYKRKNYQFGKYNTEMEIQNAFLERKIFVLKGGWRTTTWVLSIVFGLLGLYLLIFFLIMIIELFWLGILTASIFFFFELGLILIKRIFLVISPLGVYWRKIIRKGFFSWNDVKHVRKEAIRAKYGHIYIATVYLTGEKKIKFAPRPYLIKEFPKELFELQMFFNLFKIYFKMNFNKSFNG